LQDRRCADRKSIKTFNCRADFFQHGKQAIAMGMIGKVKRMYFRVKAPTN
jgi:hypothetical protein